MSFSDSDFQRPLDEIEVDLNQEKRKNEPSAFPKIEVEPSPQVKQWIAKSKAWFQTLPKLGQAAVVLGGVWLGFSILGALLHIVSSILSIAAIGCILYVGYRLFSTEAEDS